MRASTVLVLLLSLVLASCAIQPRTCRPVGDVVTKTVHPGDTRPLSWLAEVWVGVRCPFRS